MPLETPSRDAADRRNANEIQTLVLWTNSATHAIASPVAADGKLFFINEEGSTLVLDATGADDRELTRNEIGEEVYASPAISQGRFFVRTAKSRVCIGAK